MSESNYLYMHNISKSFPGVKALSNVDLEVRQGEVHALLGENGAGKSTLLKILSGAYTKDEGEIFVNGKKAYSLYNKYMKQIVMKEAICLPSTSPANAAWNIDRLVEAWKIINE